MAFENVFGNIDFQAPNRAQQQNAAMMANSFANLLANRERQKDREFKQRQYEAEAGKINLERKAQEALYNRAQGLPHDESAIQAYSTYKGSQTFIDPNTGNHVTKPSLAQRAGLEGGGYQGGGYVPSEPNGEPMGMDRAAAYFENLGRQNGSIPASPIPTAPVITPESQITQNLQVGGGLAGTPVGDKMEAQANLGLQKDKAMKDYEAEIKFAADRLKTEKGQKSVSTILNRMGEINEMLKKDNAIIHDNMPALERVGKYAETSGVGQEYRKVKNPRVQALAEEYTRLQSTLLPYYATAAGLGAKSLDSEGERKSILDSFGSPSGIYESNKSQLETLNKLFSGKPQTEAKEEKTSRTVSYKDYF